MLNIQKWIFIFLLSMSIVGCGGGSSEQASAPVTGTEEVNSAFPLLIAVNGGVTITLKGDHFKTDVNYTVLINGIEATHVTVVDEQTIQFTAPEAQIREDITLVLMRDTRILWTLKDVLKYDGKFKLDISKVFPTHINVDGGEVVTVYGRGFSDEMTVFIDNKLYDYIYLDETRITLQTEAGSLGQVSDIRILSEDQNQTLSSALTYVDKRLKISEITPHTGYNIGGEIIKISGENFSPMTQVFFGIEPVPVVKFISSTELSVISPTQFAGIVDLKVIDSRGGEVKSTYIYTEAPSALNPAPYIVSAHALDNTHILINFSEPMAEGTDTLEFYSVHSDENAATLLIKSVELKSQTLFELTTFPMSEITYILKVNGVKDRAGASILAESRENDFGSAPFRGVGESVALGASEVDSDGDGLSDAAEQRGFIVHYTLTSGEIKEEAVTSDPRVADTDGDGMSDYAEYAASTNPRSADTDKDTLSDNQEYNVYLSDPLKQDTDDDGLNDVTELGYGTSLILADTDGDQYTDFDEIYNRGRKPRVADLPLPKLSFTSISAAIDVRFNEVQSDGTNVAVEESYSGTATHDTGTVTETFAHFGIEVGVSGEIGSGIAFGGEQHIPAAKVGASIGFSTAFGTDTTTLDTLTREYAQSLTHSSVRESSTEVSREVHGARVSVGVTFDAVNDIAFTMKNIELSLLVQDPSNPERLKPIATLVPMNDALAVSVGPLTGARGPIIFSSTEVIPSEVEQFMKNPSFYAVKIVNYDLEDENARNFAYASQEVVEKTAGFTIIYNNGQRLPETYRIATAGRFTSSGVPIGVSLEEVLLGIQLYKVDDEGESIANLEIVEYDNPGGVTGSVSGDYYVNNTFSVTNGELARVRDVQIALKDRTPEGYDFWVLLDKYGVKVDATDLNNTFLKAKDNYLLVYTKDLDGDGFSEAEEVALGTKDTLCDSDGDGLSDYREVMGKAIPYLTTESTHPRNSAGTLCPTESSILDDNEPYAWRVALFERLSSVGGEPEIRSRYYRAFSSPMRPDSDEDGLEDAVEFKQIMDLSADIPIWRADPLLQDTDADGLSDREELNGYTYIGIDSGGLENAPVDGDGIDTLPPFINVKDSEGDGVTDGLEQVFGLNPAVNDADSFVDSDKDGLADKYQTNLNGTFITACKTTFPITTEQTNILSGVAQGSDKGDADGDGLPDVWEYFLCTNPMESDTDGDGLTDYNEWNHKNPATYTALEQQFSAISTSDFTRARAACEYALNCRLDSEASLKYGTDPKDADTDGDTLDDDEELEGWDVWLKEYNSDGSRVSAYHVSPSPFLKDSDGDGAQDDLESTLTTNPYLYDTDGDGANDKVENTDGRDPLAKEYMVRVYLESITNTKARSDAQTDQFTMANIGSVSLAKQDGTTVEIASSTQATKWSLFNHDFPISNTAIPYCFNNGALGRVPGSPIGYYAPSLASLDYAPFVTGLPTNYVVPDANVTYSYEYNDGSDGFHDRWYGIRSPSHEYPNTFLHEHFYKEILIVAGEIFSPEILLTEGANIDQKIGNPLQVPYNPYYCSQEDADNPAWLTTTEPVSFSDIIKTGIYKATLTGASSGATNSEWEAVYRFEVLNQ